jgi:hypothetical protein
MPSSFHFRTGAYLDVCSLFDSVPQCGQTPIQEICSCSGPTHIVPLSDKPYSGMLVLSFDILLLIMHIQDMWPLFYLNARRQCFDSLKIDLVNSSFNVFWLKDMDPKAPSPRYDVAATSDEWTDTSGHHYITVTIHWMNGHLDIGEMCIGIRVLDDHATHDNLNMWYSSLISDSGLSVRLLFASFSFDFYHSFGSSYLMWPRLKMFLEQS